MKKNKKNKITRRSFVRNSTMSLMGASGLASSKFSMMDATKSKTKEKSSKSYYEPRKSDIIIENDDFKLIISSDAKPKSLISKAINEECLIQGTNIPISAITQERPYQNEIKLAYPCEEKTFKANTIQKDDNLLTIGYDLIPYKIVIEVNSNPHYIEFKLKDLVIEDEYSIMMGEPPVWKVQFLQLPVRERSSYGDWLNVIWDNDAATNILSTNEFTRISADEMEEFYLLKAGAERDIKLRGTSATLICCSTDNLLDNISKVEKDFELAPGVQSRRKQEYKYSYYWSGDVNLDNIDKHIKYAKMSGFKAFSIYYPSFLKSKGAYSLLGDYDWNSHYPNGKEDLKKIINKIKEAGIIPGVHFLHSFIGLESKYLNPPDHRLNLIQTLTLSKDLDRDDTVIEVDENSSWIVKAMEERQKILKIGNELISFSGFTDGSPYKITGCKRGVLGTEPNSYQTGYKFGILDVSEFGGQSVYINQNNDLQDEIAKKIKEIYDCGFEFCYYDGSEGVNAPFWCNVARAQWRVHKRFDSWPLFAEGAAKTHFSWHMLSRGNAFDVFRPEFLKEEVKRHPAAEAPRMEQNFTHINFGWLGYFTPNKDTIGTQPDMIEYTASRAAAWDCHISIQSNLELFEKHPRTADNFQVMKRWEKARVDGWLSKDQKQELKDLDQEHILLINENDEFEMQRYDQITNIGNNNNDEIRAFLFKRKDDWYVVYWHISDDKKIRIPVSPKNVTLMKDLNKKTNIKSDEENDNIIVPVNNRKYMRFEKLTKDDILLAFKNAKLV